MKKLTLSSLILKESNVLSMQEKRLVTGRGLCIHGCFSTQLCCGGWCTFPEEAEDISFCY